MCPWAAGASVASHSEIQEAWPQSTPSDLATHGRLRDIAGILQGDCPLSAASDSRRHFLDATALSRERRAYLSCAAWSAAAVVSEVTTGALFHSASSS